MIGDRWGVSDDEVVRHSPCDAVVLPGATTPPQTAVRTAFLTDALGSGAEVPGLLGVNRSQPSQWRSGKESPSPRTAQQLLGQDYVMAKALHLTLYTVHLLALAAMLHYEVPLLWFLIHAGVAALFAVAWYRAYGRGPLERALARTAGTGRRLVLAPARGKN